MSDIPRVATPRHAPSLHDRVRVVQVPAAYHVHRLARGEVVAMKSRYGKTFLWMVKMDDRIMPLAFREHEIEKV